MWDSLPLVVQIAIYVLALPFVIQGLFVAALLVGWLMMVPFMLMGKILELGK